MGDPTCGGIATSFWNHVLHLQRLESSFKILQVPAPGLKILEPWSNDHVSPGFQNHGLVQTSPRLQRFCKQTFKIIII